MHIYKFRLGFWLQKLKVFLGISLLSVMLMACREGGDGRVLKTAHALPTDHPVHAAIMFFADRTEELSGGKIKVQVYSGGQLGGERELMELLQIGSLAIAKVSSSPMESFVPEMKVFSMPYVMRDEDHYWQVLKGPIGKQLLLEGEKVRLRGIGYYDAGARSFYTVDVPVHKPEDLDGLKIRVQKSQTSIQMVNSLGGTGTPISFGELYTALDQGVVDGAENNPPSVYSIRHYEVAKYYSLNEHSYVPDIMLISTYIWNQLSEEEQGWVQQAMDESVEFQRELWRKSTEEALAAMEESGVTIIRPDKTAFAEKVKPMHEAIKGEPAYDLIQEIRKVGLTDE
jgi:tripartite ATP-independent transporter DctP family solute receptor